MLQFTLITGNENKLKEWRSLIPNDFEFYNQSIDLDELQSIDSSEIVRHKLRQAYGIVNGPVVVEDVSAGLDKWNGLPGPFIKFFMSKLGKDALYQLGGDGAAMTVTCTVGYYDGQKEIIVSGELAGTAVLARGEAYGFDVSFMPNGHTKTYAEMSADEKNSISHRRLAVDKLLEELKRL